MKSAVSILMVTLLASALTMAVDVRLVSAGGTTYIRADGSVDPPTAPIASVDNITYTFTGNMSASFAIERDNIVVDGAGFTIGGNDSIVTISGRNNVTVQKISLRYVEDWFEVSAPLLIELSTDIKVVECILGPVDMASALQISSSSDCLVHKNDIETMLNDGSGSGINISLCSDIIIRENQFHHYGWAGMPGLSITSSSHNIIEGNDMVGTDIRIDSSSSNNTLFNNTVHAWGTAVFVSGPSNNIMGNQMSAHHGDFHGRALVIYSPNNTVVGNELEGAVVYNNESEFRGNSVGELYLVSASRNMFSGNQIEFLYLQMDSWGDGTGTCSNNTFYHNIIGEILYYRGVGGELPALHNFWDAGYPSGGNYWGSHSGLDLYSGPYQNETGSDGIVDTPFLIAPNNRDNYPFTHPCYDLDAAVTQVSPCRTALPQGELLSVNVTVENQGLLPVTFNLTVDVTHTYAPVERPVWLSASAAQGWNSSIPGPDITVYLGDTVALTLESADSLHHLFYVDLNSNQFPDGGEPQSPSFINEIITFSFSATTLGAFTYYCAYHQGTMFGELLVVTPPPPLIVQVGSQSVSLTQNEERTITFTWNTTGCPRGRYDVSAYASPALGEVDTSDNTLIYGWVFVTIHGDVDGDRDVDIFDIVRMAGVYGVSQPDPRYDPNCDIDGDGDTDIFDIVKAAGNYGESW